MPHWAPGFHAAEAVEPAAALPEKLRCLLNGHTGSHISGPLSARAPHAALRRRSPGALRRGSWIAQAAPHPAWRDMHHKNWRDAAAGNQWPAARAPAPIALVPKPTRAPITLSLL